MKRKKIDADLVRRIKAIDEKIKQQRLKASNEKEAREKGDIILKSVFENLVSKENVFRMDDKIENNDVTDETRPDYVYSNLDSTLSNLISEKNTNSLIDSTSSVKEPFQNGSNTTLKTTSIKNDRLKN